MKLVNLVLYLRAGYYQASGGSIPALTETVRAPLRASLHSLVQGAPLYGDNPRPPPRRMRCGSWSPI